MVLKDIGQHDTCIMGKIEELEVFKKSFFLALEIHKLTLSFPKEELYSLTDQLRRSSRSVCANLKEGYRKRIYQKHFISKLSDADAENSEVQLWLRFSIEFGYINPEKFTQLYGQSESIGRLLGYMMKHPDKFM